MITKFPILPVLIICFLANAACGPSSNGFVSKASMNISPTGLRQTGIVLLGTGTPNADPGRMGPSLAIIVDNKAYVVDCGTGVVRRASSAFQKGIPSLEPSRLDTLFITHLHSDHTIGFPDIYLTPGVLDRMRPFKVFGPPGTEAMTRHIQEAYQEDVVVRIEGLEPANPEGYIVVPEDCEPGLVYRDDHVSVSAFPARHGAWRHAFGYRFDTPNLRICLSGDTAPYPLMDEHYRHCDVLIHEVYSKAGFARRTPEWQAYHAANHTSGVELGEIAARVKPKLLILTHQLMWGASERELMAEIRLNYNGPVIFGNDLDYISFPAVGSAGSVDAPLRFRLVSLAKKTLKSAK